MNTPQTNETTPADLLVNFNGRSLKSIITFTVVAHAVLLLVTSAPYLWKAVAGTDSSKLSESERIELAVTETKAAMRRIAEQHGLQPQDLGSRFAAPKAEPKPAPAAESKSDPQADPKTAPEANPNPPPPATAEPKSSIEKELRRAEPGPTVPAVGDDDLFK